jgi:hypothetical protein
MRLESVAVALVLAAASAGAADDPARLVRGKWALDVKLSAEKQPGYKDATPEQFASLGRKIAAAAPDAVFEFTGTTYSFGWGGRVVQKGTFVAGFGARTPGKEVIGLTTQPEGSDPDTTDMISIGMDGPDTMHVNQADIPYTLTLRRVK